MRHVRGDTVGASVENPPHKMHRAGEAVNTEYQELLDALIPGWRSRTSLEIIGSLLEEIKRLKNKKVIVRRYQNPTWSLPDDEEIP